MFKSSHTYIAIPPGETIKEQLEYRNMSQKEFATRMEMSEKHICHLLNGDVILTQETALKLEMVLQVPAYIWNGLETEYRQALIKIELENKIDLDQKIQINFPNEELKKLGWLDESKSKQDQVLNLRKFFEVTNLKLLYDENLLPRICCGKANDNIQNDYVLMAWLQKAKLESRKIETARINPNSLQKNLNKVRKLTLLKPNEFIEPLTELLAKYGVAFIYLTRLTNLSLDGATYIANKKVILAVGKRIVTSDIFWMTLFHELGHIVLEHIKYPEEVGQAEERDCEIYINNILIPKDDYNEFINNKIFNESSISSFADKIGINKGLVINRLEIDKLIEKGSFDYLKQMMIE